MGRGVIVHLGSASSFVATPCMVQYTTAKHALIGLTKNAGKSDLQIGRQAGGFADMRVRYRSCITGWARLDKC